MLASDEAFVVNKADGQLVIVSHADSTPTMTYGPGRRLWPAKLFGSTLFLLSTDPQLVSLSPTFDAPAEQEAFIYRAGKFVDLGIKGGIVNTVERNPIGFAAAMASNQSVYLLGGFPRQTLIVVDAKSGMQRRRELSAPGLSWSISVLTQTHAWINGERFGLP